MSILQEYLRGGGSLSDLTSNYGITIKPDIEYSNLLLFKYNQIESPMGVKIVQECRGIILDSADNWRIVSRAFDKFFNTGEGHAAPIDWNNAIVQEKLDGSMMTLYYYKGKWRVASSGNPSAQGTLGTNEDLKFADYFWQAFRNQNLLLPENTDICFVFELTGPLNRVVIPHTEVSITLLSARNLVTQREYLAHEVNEKLNTDFPIVAYHEYKSLAEIIESFGFKSPLTHEGCIVLSVNEDGSINRQKAKHPGYVAIHHARSGFSDKSFLEIVRSGENSEVIAFYPEFENRLKEITEKYEQLNANLTMSYDQYRYIENQKEFAQAIRILPLSSALFSVRSGKVRSIREYLSTMRIENLMSVLNLN